MEIPRTLRERLGEGKVIPFAGAGVSMAVTDTESAGIRRLFPSWKELLLHAGQRLTEEGKAPYADVVRGFVGMGEYLEAARRARQGLGPAWFDFLKEQFDHSPERADDESLALARLMWGLGNQLVVTTNYDRVLHWANPQPRNVRLWNIKAPAEQLKMLREGLRNPTVWHLHGYIDDAAGLILTPNGYSLLYPEPGAETEYASALRTLHTLLASHSLLFVGFSMGDEQFGLQLKRVHDMFKGAPGPHYVLVPEAEKARVASLDLPVEILTYSDYGPPLLAALAELAEAANVAATPPLPSHSEKPAAIALESDSETSAPEPVFSVPFSPKKDDVIGREPALQAVRKQLVEGRRTQIGQTAAFQGLGGLGKTQLAVEYAYRFRDEYPGGVIWLTADQDIGAQLTELAPKAGWIAAESEHKYKLDVALQRLRTHSGLLVFDNVESRDVVEPYLPLRETGAHILLTSRTEQQGFIPVPLNLLDMEQSLELLTREAGRKPQGAAEQEALREIAERLGGLPLALELAGAFIRHREIGWGLYRDRLSQNPRKALSGKFLQSSTEHESDLYSTLQIDEEVFEDEPLLREILDVFAWSGPAPMGISLLSAMLALDDPTELTDALGLGVTLRLIQKTPGTDNYAIHRLVSEVWRESHPVSGRQEWVGSTCSRLGDWFQQRKENFFDLTVFEAEIDHLRAWQEHAVAVPLDEVVRLLWLQAYPPYHRGQYSEAQRYVEEALEALHEQANTGGQLHADLLNDLGSTSWGLGKYKEALASHEQALAIRQELFGEQHHDTANSFNNIGTAYSGLGEPQKALDYHQRALSIRQELFGDRHPDTALSLNNVGTAYVRLGEYWKALRYQERAVAIREGLFGEQHPDTANSLSNIGSTYSDLGERMKALRCHERALAIRQELFGEQHPDTAISLSNVGTVFVRLGEPLKALEYKREAFKIIRHVLGESHPQTVHVGISTSTTLIHLDKHAEAFDLLHELSRRLDHHHPSYSAVQQRLQGLSKQAVRPGFRQPSTSKQSPNKKEKSKRKR